MEDWRGCFAGWLLGGFDAPGLTFLATQTNDSTEETSLSGGITGSPAVDQGKKSGRKFDQRGHLRPRDYFLIPNAPGGDGSDIGAFEREN